jgi:hypothetical protein
MSSRFRLVLKSAAAATPTPVAAPATKAVKISTALKELFAANSITDRVDLDAWCGEANRSRLYAYLREQAPEHWARVSNPKAVTRATYQNLLTGYGEEAKSASDEEKPVLSSRISNRASAEALIGQICTYVTAEGREYGHILRATASEIILDRMSMTATGGFVPHSVPVCPRSRNRVTYSRDIRLVRGGAKPKAPTSISAETLALKLAEELTAAQRREITRLGALEAELLDIKAKAAERKRVADEEAAILAEAKRRLAAEEAAILAEAKCRLAEEAKEQRIQAAMKAMRPSAISIPSTKETLVD